MSDSEFAPDYEDPEEEKDHSPPSALKDTKVDKESKKQSGKEEKKEPVKKIKGRGHLAQFEQDDSTKYGGASGNFDTLAAEEKNKHKALKSVGGFIVFLRNLHEETEEDDIFMAVRKFGGEYTQIQLNLDRRSGYAKGYCLLEFETLPEAQTAVKHLNGSKLTKYGEETALDKIIQADFAFKNAPVHEKMKN